MTWTDYDRDPLQVAAEQYLWWRNSGFTLWEMEDAINQSGGKKPFDGKYGKPESMCGDDMVYWLASIWDTKL